LKKTKNCPEILISKITDNKINEKLIELTKLSLQIEEEKRPSTIFILEYLSNFIIERTTEILSIFNTNNFRWFKLYWEMSTKFL
jgi:hypothetical protein